MRIAGSDIVVDNKIIKTLQEIGELSQTGASEREIETEIVALLKELGWSRPHIKQDVSLSDKATDKADIVITVNNLSFLFEIKRNGELRGAEEQVRRYCRLLIPSPKMAFLTDGVRWTIFYVGREYILKLAELAWRDSADQIALFLQTMEQFRALPEDQTSLFEYLDLIDEGLQKRSDFVQANLVGYFVSTILYLLSVPRSKQIQSTPVPVESATQAPNSDVFQLPLLTPPLKYSKMQGILGGRNVDSWRSLVHAAIAASIESGMTAQQIHQITKVNLRDGTFAEGGFVPVANTSISVQGMEARRSWQVALTLAQRLKIPIEIEVTWYPQAPEELHSKVGTLKWHPEPNK